MKGTMMNLNDELEINVYTWFGEREVKTNSPPAHFVKSSVAVTTQGKNWISEKCEGRYWIGPQISSFAMFGANIVYFEDPKELLMYELTHG